MTWIVKSFLKYPATGLVCFIVLCIGCSNKHGRDPRVADLGKVDKRLKEASGLVASVNNPGFLWTVNDSNNPAEIFLIDDKAAIRMVCKLKAVENRDWEEVAVQTEANGKNYIYVGEIGDNDAKYPFKFIYRFEEPVLQDREEIVITQFDTLVLKMEDGPRDTETILIDPLTHDLYLVSKREESVGLYRAAYPFTTDTLIMKKVLTMPFQQIVAGNISSNGKNILLKAYGHVYYWERGAEETVAQVLAREPRELPYEREPQGESIAWSRDASSYYTLSESPPGKRAHLFRTTFE